MFTWLCIRGCGAEGDQDPALKGYQREGAVCDRLVFFSPWKEDACHHNCLARYGVMLLVPFFFFF